MSWTLCLNFSLAWYRPSITFPPGLSCHRCLRGKWPSWHISGPFCRLATPLSPCLSFITLITWMLSCTRLFPYFDLAALRDFIVILLQHQMVLSLDGLSIMTYLQSWIGYLHLTISKAFVGVKGPLSFSSFVRVAMPSLERCWGILSNSYSLWPRCSSHAWSLSSFASSWIDWSTTLYSLWEHFFMLTFTPL